MEEYRRRIIDIFNINADRGCVVAYRCPTVLRVNGQLVGILTLSLEWIHNVLQDGVQELIGDIVCLGDKWTEDVHHEVLDLSRVFIIYNLKHETKKGH